eukprot:scaffold32490_cov22-Tisochrysis_lutea.AAC.1
MPAGPAIPPTPACGVWGMPRPTMGEGPPAKPCCCRNWAAAACRAAGVPAPFWPIISACGAKNQACKCVNHTYTSIYDNDNAKKTDQCM